jgi:hypothetical protein
VAGGGYTGATGTDQAGGGSRVSFQVSRSGKALTSITFQPPIEFTGGCVSPNTIPFVTTVVSMTDEAKLLRCSGSNTWTAHASGH